MCDRDEETWNFKKKTLNFGELGKYSLYIFINEKGEMDINMDNGYDDLFHCRFEIKYCPYCGRKLDVQPTKRNVPAGFENVPLR